MFPLHLADLIAKSNINAECYDEARMVFNSKYKQRAFELQLWNLIRKYEAIDESKALIKISNYDLSQNFLNNFGDLVHQLAVSFYFDNGNHGREIVKAINDNCFESVSSLALTSCSGSSLDELQNTFTNVDSLTFSTIKLDLSSDKKLSKIFPNVKSLVDETVASDWTFIDATFPRLTNFEVNFAENQSPDSVHQSHISSFLKNNTQIKELTIVRSNLALLKEVNEILPQLEQLSLTFLAGNFSGDQKDPVHFKAVKHLSLQTRYAEMPEMAVFDQLDTLTMDIQTKISTKWIDFISNQVNRNVSNLNLFIDVNPSEFAIISEKFTNLRVAHVTSTSIFKAEHIVDFIERSQELKQLKLVAILDEDEWKRLEEVIPETWSVLFYKPGYYVEIYLLKSNASDDL